MEKSEEMDQLVAQVIVDVPAFSVNKPFDYLIPGELGDKVRVGSRVAVPFGSRFVQGYVIALTTRSDHAASLKEITALLDDMPPLTEELIELARWMSHKYVCFLSTAIQTILPSAYKSIKGSGKGKNSSEVPIKDHITKRTVTYVLAQHDPPFLEQYIQKLPKQASKQREMLRCLAEQPKVPLKDLLKRCQATRTSLESLVKKGLVTLVQEEAWRAPYEGRNYPVEAPHPLTEEQQEVLQRIRAAIAEKKHRTFLLHGVTGSGKTEIYLHAIDHVLKQGREVIVVVPEIALTAQMVERFKRRFQEQVAVIHSGLSTGERYDAWQKIRKKEVKVAIGARSALFAPFQNLGLIIVDEEHESSYKQEETPKYHARDVALFRGEYHQAPVVLGSATPSLESYSRARKNVYTLLTLKQRVTGVLPPVEIVDMRREMHSGNRSLLSRTLYRKIEERLARKEQMVLFLNRRGFSTLVICRNCGYVLQCPHCEISLTYHKVNQTCRCHYCGYTQPLEHACPQCQSPELRFLGTGTQKVEETLAQTFPGIRVIRMDVDTTRRKGTHEQLLAAFERHEADCLLGTQMIAKGLDFENVTLVGVISADSLLYLPDFRSAERTFQLLTQVSGRTGRHKKPGEVVVQTFSPDHYSILSAAKHDYQKFYELEMRFRHKQGYPPFYFLCLVQFAHEDLAYCIKSAEKAVEWLKRRLSPESIVLGPIAAPIARIKDRYRYQCMIKYKNEPQLSTYLMELLEAWQTEINRNKLQLTIDMEPQMIL